MPKHNNVFTEPTRRRRALDKQVRTSTCNANQFVWQSWVRCWPSQRPSVLFRVAQSFLRRRTCFRLPRPVGSRRTLRRPATSRLLAAATAWRPRLIICRTRSRVHGIEADHWTSARLRTAVQRGWASIMSRHTAMAREHPSSMTRQALWCARIA